MLSRKGRVRKSGNSARQGRNATGMVWQLKGTSELKQDPGMVWGKNQLP